MTGLAAVPFDLNSKSEAIKYAISIAMNTDKNGKLTVDLVWQQVSTTLLLKG